MHVFEGFLDGVGHLKGGLIEEQTRSLEHSVLGSLGYDAHLGTNFASISREFGGENSGLWRRIGRRIWWYRGSHLGMGGEECGRSGGRWEGENGVSLDDAIMARWFGA